MAGLKKKRKMQSNISIESPVSLKSPGVSKSNQKKSVQTGREIYEADYGDVTPEEVAKAILTYRR